MSQWFGGSGRKPDKDPGRSPDRRTEGSSNPRGRPQTGSRSFQEPQKRVNNGRGFDITPKKTTELRNVGNEAEFADSEYGYEDETQKPSNQSSRPAQGFGQSGRAKNTWQQEPPANSGNGRQPQGFKSNTSNSWPQSNSRGAAPSDNSRVNNRFSNQSANPQPAPMSTFYGGQQPKQQAAPDADLVYEDDSNGYNENLGQSEEGASEAVPDENAALRKRAIALLFDVLVCYMAAVCVMLVPFINKFLTVNLVLSLLLLVRDFFFDGRGVGKNVMGLQVVDSATGAPCSLRQSVIRNAVLFGPYVVSQILTTVLKFIPFGMVVDAVTNLLNLVGAVYVTIVIPLEVYRVYSRSDGLRLGDRFAGTEIVEADMDFSTPVQKNW